MYASFGHPEAPLGSTNRYSESSALSPMAGGLCLLNCMTMSDVSDVSRLRTLHNPTGDSYGESSQASPSDSEDTVWRPPKVGPFSIW